MRESLRAGRRRPRRLLVASGAGATGAVSEIGALAEAAGVTVEEAQRHELDRLTDGANHQGVCLMTSPYRYEALPDIISAASSGLYLALDSLQDPQNLGSLLRTADAVAVDGVVMPEHRAVGVTPAVVNASAGAVEHVRVAIVPNLARALAELKDAGAWVLGLEATPDAVPLWQVELDGPFALVVGSEGEGIRRLVLEQCDVVARLPLLGRVESLNAAVAGSVGLYELLRRQAPRK